MKIVTVLNDQTLQDICLQEFGDVEFLFDLALFNDLSPTHSLIIGQQIKIPQVDNPRIEIVDFYAQNNIKSASSGDSEAVSLIPEEDECNFCKYFQ